MIPKAWAELHRLQVAAVVATKPFARDSGIRVADTPLTILRAADDVRAALVTARMLSLFCSREAAQQMRTVTAPAWDAIESLITECQRELGQAEAS